MDELNVQQLWGISPPLDLETAAKASVQRRATSSCTTTDGRASSTAVLQVCPYDCRHMMATIGTLAQLIAAREGHQMELYVYETEPEGLARHMLLLTLLFDDTLSVRERAEMFLEVHGNTLLHQRTADWVANASRWLEAAVCGTGSNAAAQNHQQQQQQQQRSPAHAACGLFDFSLLRYKERDFLAETFENYRSKASFNMAGAWEGRCRKWYGDRYDSRQNMIDWDYHMRLSQRGRPCIDPAAGSIIHFYHFRHWRLTGVAYELRESSYTATNTSMLATAYGRTREYKDRYLRDVGRSVSAYGYWGEIINPPYHAFGTTSSDHALFKVVNKQFSHTAVDVAEHNVMEIIKQLSGAAAMSSTADGGSSHTQAAAQAAHDTRVGSSGEPHRARAARGPTSLEHLAAASSAAQEQQVTAVPLSSRTRAVTDAAECKGAGVTDTDAADVMLAAQEAQADAAGAFDQATGRLQELSVNPQHQRAQKKSDDNQKQQQHKQQEQQRIVPQPAQPELQQDAGTAATQAAREAAQTSAAVQRLLAFVRVYLLTGDLKRSLTGKAAYAGRFAAATVGHRHAHMLGADYGLASVLQPGAPVFVETAANMVQLTAEQVAAFDSKLLELAAAAGYQQHPGFSTAQQSEQQGATDSAVVGAGGQQSARAASESIGGQWQMPPGHLALCGKPYLS